MADFEPRSARKRFGQHFLVDAYAVDEIIRTVDARPGDHVIEIGPGEGVLTQHLVASGAELLAIEIDRDLVLSLNARFAKAGNFSLHSGDVLKFDSRGRAQAMLRIDADLDSLAFGVKDTQLEGLLFVGAKARTSDTASLFHGQIVSVNNRRSRCIKRLRQLIDLVAQ